MSTEPPKPEDAQPPNSDTVPGASGLTPQEIEALVDSFYELIVEVSQDEQE